MILIGELSELTGISTHTIRYYERIGLLRAPVRAANGYRLYDQSDVELLNFIRRARSLDFGLDEIAEILKLRDHHEPPCHYVLTLMQARLAEIEAHIRELEDRHNEILNLYNLGQQLPEDPEMRSCVCYLIQTPSTHS